MTYNLGGCVVMRERKGAMSWCFFLFFFSFGFGPLV
jgi:hypothetical protein